MAKTQEAWGGIRVRQPCNAAYIFICCTPEPPPGMSANLMPPDQEGMGQDFQDLLQAIMLLPLLLTSVSSPMYTRLQIQAVMVQIGLLLSGKGNLLLP